MAIEVPWVGRPYRVAGRDAICVGIVPGFMIFCYTHNELIKAREQGEELPLENFKVPLDDSSIEEIIL